MKLVMIVRDEEEWIVPALESACAVGIQSWLIADTGSTDRTKEVLDLHLGHLPGEIIDLPWEGHRATRTELFRRAYGYGDWLLMMDADMTIHGEAPARLEHDAYRATVRQDGWEYSMLVLFKGSRRWSYEGVVHSYPDVVGEDWTAASSDLVIIDRRRGAFRPEKLQEDATALERALEDDPLDARSSYYLAQTYEDMGRTADAIREFGRRALLGGWDEERFIAKYRRAKLLRERAPLTALCALLEAWQERTTRAEPLYQAARLCRMAGWDDLALVFARRAVAISRPPDRLNIEPAIYEWGCQLELAIAEIRAGDAEAGKRLLRKLRPATPDGTKEWIDELLGEVVTA